MPYTKGWGSLCGISSCELGQLGRQVKVLPKQTDSRVYHYIFVREIPMASPLGRPQYYQHYYWYSSLYFHYNTCVRNVIDSADFIRSCESRTHYCIYHCVPCTRYVGVSTEIEVPRGTSGVVTTPTVRLLAVELS